MQNFLLITYRFPPVLGANSVRIGKFAKYLPELGWMPVVFTSNLRKSKFSAREIDNQLLDHIPTGVKIFRISSMQTDFRGAWRLDRWLPEPGLLTSWVIRSVFLGITEAKKNACEAVMSSATPGACHIIGFVISKWLKIPLIIEYRDQWSNNPYRTFANPFHSRWVRFLEKKVLQASSAIITVSDQRAAEMASFWNIPLEDIHVIPNGIDLDDFKTIARHEAQTGAMTLKIRHIGTIYGGRETSFLRFMEKLGQVPLDSWYKAGIREICIELVGDTPDIIFDKAKSLCSSAIIITKRHTVNYKTAIQLMCDASMLLLVIGDYNSSNAETPSKIYEYLASKVPVIVCGKSLAVDAIMKDIPRIAFYYPSSDEIEKLPFAVRELITTYSQYADKIDINQCSREQGAKKLATLLSSLVRKSV